MNWEVAALDRGPVWGVILECGERLRQNTEYFIRLRPENWNRNFSIRNSWRKNFTVTSVTWEDDDDDEELWVGGGWGGGVNFKDAVVIIPKNDAGFLYNLVWWTPLYYLHIKIIRVSRVDQSV